MMDVRIKQIIEIVKHINNYPNWFRKSYKEREYIWHHLKISFLLNILRVVWVGTWLTIQQLLDIIPKLLGDPMGLGPAPSWYGPSEINKCKSIWLHIAELSAKVLDCACRLLLNWILEKTGDQIRVPAECDFTGGSAINVFLTNQELLTKRSTWLENDPRKVPEWTDHGQTMFFKRFYESFGWEPDGSLPSRHNDSKNGSLSHSKTNLKVELKTVTLRK